MRRYVRKYVISFRFFPLIFLFSVLAFNSASSQDMSRGEELFQPCKACHVIGEERLIGPGLKGITERRSREWLIPYIRNSQAVIESGDEYAVALWEEYQIPMPPYEDYTDDDINAILDYIEAYDPAAEAAAQEQTVAASGHGEEEDGYMADTKHPWANFRASFLISIVLILLSIIDLTLTRIIKARFIHVIVILISVSVITEITILEAQALGRQHYYEPDQPILFSHKVHAGQNKIDCQYCHTTVETSKQAGIPHVQMCMNCHNVVRQGTHTGTAEISKIYKAIETGNPIEWIRVHNLPDHAYFNHAQHVGAGKLDCTECHGNVEEMERIQQVNDLSMGWCIECHRDREVQFFDNDFYTKYTKLHEDLEAGRIEKVTVEMIGGNECSKCHY
jgi:mono/diheme cytochrome c family protein